MKKKKNLHIGTRDIKKEAVFFVTDHFLCTNHAKAVSWASIPKFLSLATEFPFLLYVNEISWSGKSVLVRLNVYFGGDYGYVIFSLVLKHFGVI